MSRAVFLSIIHLYVMDRRWFLDFSSNTRLEIINSFHHLVEANAAEITCVNKVKEGKTPVLNAGKHFASCVILVKEEIARLTFQSIDEKLSRGEILVSSDISLVMMFVSSPDYEVKLIALEFLQKLFLKSSNVFLSSEDKDKLVGVLLTRLWHSQTNYEVLSSVR